MLLDCGLGSTLTLHVNSCLSITYNTATVPHMSSTDKKCSLWKYALKTVIDQLMQLVTPRLQALSGISRSHARPYC
jgi:hypothetical protein